MFKLNKIPWVPPLTSHQMIWIPVIICIKRNNFALNQD